MIIKINIVVPAVNQILPFKVKPIIVAATIDIFLNIAATVKRMSIEMLFLGIEETRS